ncbi:AAA domain-containing protein [Clostridium sp. BJN0001]|uniref:AAA domain-containing protein n=1 Tax=Clostridium sp. BJN0001 TaxID=2930219 RepID=UPI001FD234E7|nr:AAA domain-containing protein [Clostridium sp. BJN0001]
MNQTSKFTEYFRNVLVAEHKDIIDLKNEENAFEIVFKENIFMGEVPEAVYKFLIESVIHKNKYDLKFIDIIIIARTVKNHITEGQSDENNIEDLFGVFYIPARLSYDGRLEIPVDNKLPWFPREVLEPMVEPLVSLGDTKKVDYFIENTVDRYKKIKKWDDYIKYCAELYQEVTGIQISEDNPGKFEVNFQKNMYIVLDNTIQASFHIEKLYQDIKKNKCRKYLYEQFLKNDVEKSKTLISNNSIEKMIEHCGQMGGEYPLAESQREAVNHFNELNEGGILAISGPPGTGKTTLLQSIVANLYVRNALNREKAPIIVASSTNNQAVTNIIDSFSKIDSIGIANLEKRWINEVTSFALYFPSKNKEKEAKEKGYQYTSNKWDNYALSIDEEQFMQDSIIKMIDNCNEFFKSNCLSIEECRDMLHTRLTCIDKIRCNIIHRLSEIYTITGNIDIGKFLGILKKNSKEKKEEIIKISEKLDCIEKKIDSYRRRTDEWKQIYQNINWFIRLLKVIPKFNKKILTVFEINKNSYEVDFLKENMNIDEIQVRYSEIVKSFNKEAYELRVMINEREKEYEKIIIDINTIQRLRGKIKKLFEELENYSFNIGYSEKYKTKVDNLLEHCKLDSINNFFDVNVRYLEFWLAVHYYECRFLLGEDKITEEQRKRNIVNIYEQEYSRLAMLTPCMVMTFYKLPQNFIVYNTNEKVSTYLYNFIDLLIVDEAGQVSPEVAAASFALAKKAVVVGDEYQIPPVWGIGGALDRSIALESGAILDIQEFEKLKTTGLNCSESSVMKVAKNSCVYDKFEKGLFLSEHRRCYDEIIEYCNKLVYKGHLKACRGYGKNDSQYPIKEYPHMGHYYIEVDKSSKKGCSRINEVEATEIAKWLAIHYPNLREKYNANNNMLSHDQIIAIITPFKAQVSVIRKKLKDYIPDYEKYISVGTVHTFQGAERKIIILSTVYGKDDGCYFINVSPQLMNVAVSRAKDAFWIFGSYECLGSNQNSVGGLLKKYVNEQII